MNRQIWNKLLFDTARGYYIYLGHVSTTAKPPRPNPHDFEASLRSHGYSYGANVPLNGVPKADNKTVRKVNDCSAPDKALFKLIASRNWERRQRGKGPIPLPRPKSANFQARTRPRQGQASVQDGVDALLRVVNNHPPGSRILAFKIDWPDAFQSCGMPCYDRSLYCEILNGHVFLPTVWAFGATEAG